MHLGFFWTFRVLLLGCVRTEWRRTCCRTNNSPLLRQASSVYSTKSLMNYEVFSFADGNRHYSRPCVNARHYVFSSLGNSFLVIKQLPYVHAMIITLLNIWGKPSVELLISLSVQLFSFWHSVLYYKQRNWHNLLKYHIQAHKAQEV